MSWHISISTSPHGSAPRKGYGRAKGGANVSLHDLSPAVWTSAISSSRMRRGPATWALWLTLNHQARYGATSGAAHCAAPSIAGPHRERKGRQKGRERPRGGARSPMWRLARGGRSVPFDQRIREREREECLVVA